MSNQSWEAKELGTWNYKVGGPNSILHWLFQSASLDLQFAPVFPRPQQVQVQAHKQSSPLLFLDSVPEDWHMWTAPLLSSD